MLFRLCNAPNPTSGDQIRMQPSTNWNSTWCWLHPTHSCHLSLTATQSMVGKWSWGGWKQTFGQPGNMWFPSLPLSEVSGLNDLEWNYRKEFWRGADMSQPLESHIGCNQRPPLGSAWGASWKPQSWSLWGDKDIETAETDILLGPLLQPPRSFSHTLTAAPCGGTRGQSGCWYAGAILPLTTCKIAWGVPPYWPRGDNRGWGLGWRNVQLLWNTLVATLRPRAELWITGVPCNV